MSTIEKKNKKKKQKNTQYLIKYIKLTQYLFEYC